MERSDNTTLPGGEVSASTSQNHIFSTAVTTILVGYLCYLFYNAYLHPLAKFPGPRLAGATRWYETYFDLCIAPGGQFMYHMNRLHEKYGPIIRVGPNEVHINDPYFIDVLYGPGQKRNRVPWMVSIFGTDSSVFGTIDHDLHKSRRNVLMPYFAKRSVQNLEHSIQGKIDKMCQGISRYHQDNKIIPVRHALTACVVDTTTEYSFGKCANVLDTDDFSPEWYDMIAGVTESVPFARQFPGSVQVAQKLPLGVVRMINPLVAAFAEFEQVVRGQVSTIFDQYKKGQLNTESLTEDGSPSIFHKILGSTLPAEEKTINRMTQEAISIIGAAAETMSNNVATMVFHLTSEPSYTERLHQELRTVMPEPTSRVSWRELEKLPFLTAVVKEGLRITSSVVGRIPLTSPEPLMYQQWTMPAGTYIGMSMVDCLSNDKIFSSPYDFNPDRWLDASPEQLAQMEMAYIPFGRGSRNCLGQNLAYATIYLLLATLFRQYKFEIVDTIRARDVDCVRDHFVAKQTKQSPGVKVRVVKEY